MFGQFSVHVIFVLWPIKTLERHKNLLCMGKKSSLFTKIVGLLKIVSLTIFCMCEGALYCRMVDGIGFHVCRSCFYLDFGVYILAIHFDISHVLLISANKLCLS